MCAQSLSRVRLFAIPWTVACQAPPSRGISRQESWSGLPFPPPGDLPDPGFLFSQSNRNTPLFGYFKKKLVRYKSSGEQRVLLRHVIVHIGHVRAVSYLVRFSLDTSLIVVNIIYLPSEIYNLSLSHIALLSPFR